MKKSIFSALCLVLLATTTQSAWGAEATVTETFENQDAGTTYNSHLTYDASASVVGIGWDVEHGTVSTSAYLNDTKSMHMRAYYAKSSASSTWNGDLPYLSSTTPIVGLKSVTFNAAASNTGLKFDTYYSTDQSTWIAIQTAQSLTTTASSYSFSIPNYSTSTPYYIKIAISTSSTHASKPSSAGNYTFRVDNIAFTYESGSTPTTYYFGQELADPPTP